MLAQESATLSPPTFSQFAVTAYLANHDWQGHIDTFQNPGSGATPCCTGSPTTCQAGSS